MMKLLIVTVVEQYQEDILQLFKKANIDKFSESDIDGHKTGETLLMTSNWFASKKGAADSRLFFSFTADDKIDKAFDLIKDYNKELITYNPIKAIVVPIEKYI